MSSHQPTPHHLPSPAPHADLCHHRARAPWGDTRHPPLQRCPGLPAPPARRPCGRAAPPVCVQAGAFACLRSSCLPVQTGKLIASLCSSWRASAFVGWMGSLGGPRPWSQAVVLLGALPPPGCSLSLSDKCTYHASSLFFHAVQNVPLHRAACPACKQVPVVHLDGAYHSDHTGAYWSILGHTGAACDFAKPWDAFLPCPPHRCPS